MLLLQTLMDAVNAETALRAQSKLKLPGSQIAMLPDGDYSLVVTVTNFMAASSSSTLTFAKAGAGAAPVVSIQGGDEQVGAAGLLQPGCCSPSSAACKLAALKSSQPNSRPGLYMCSFLTPHAFLAAAAVL